MPGAMRGAVCRAIAMPPDFGARAKEPEQRSHSGVERARRLSDEHPDLAALAERVGRTPVLPLVRRDVALARGVVEGAVGLHAALSASQRSAADVLARAAEGVRAALVARRLLISDQAP